MLGFTRVFYRRQYSVPSTRHPVAGDWARFSSDINNWDRHQPLRARRFTKERMDALERNNQICGFVYLESLSGRDDGGRAVFSDDGRAGVTPAGGEIVSGVELRGELLAIEQDWDSRLGNRAELCSAGTDECVRPYVDRGGFQACSEAEGDQFDLAVRILITVAAVMFLSESLQQIPSERDIQFVALAAVAEVDAAGEMRSSLPGFAGKIMCRSFLQRGEFSIQFCMRHFSVNAP